MVRFRLQRLYIPGYSRPTAHSPPPSLLLPPRSFPPGKLRVSCLVALGLVQRQRRCVRARPSRERRADRCLDFDSHLPRAPTTHLFTAQKMAPVATDSTVHADGRVGKRIENYAAFWQKDLSKEAGQDTENRLANYTDVINGECSAVLQFFPSVGRSRVAYCELRLGLEWGALCMRDERTGSSLGSMTLLHLAPSFAAVIAETWVAQFASVLFSTRLSSRCERHDGLLSLR